MQSLVAGLDKFLNVSGEYVGSDMLHLVLDSSVFVYLFFWNSLLEKAKQTYLRVKVSTITWICLGEWRYSSTHFCCRP